MVGRVEGKVAFVTGAARGQGRSHCLRLAEEGADIIALDINASVPSMDRFYDGATPEDMEETVRLVEELDRRIVFRTADVRSLDQVKAVVDEGVAEFGHLDIVVANAGIFMHSHRVHEVDEGDWDDTMDINLKGVWHACKASVPHLLRQNTGGSVILISSAAGSKGTPNIGPYTVSKHGVVGLMRTLALELAGEFIRVNSVHPIGVGTKMILNDALYRLFRPDLEAPTLEDAIEAFRNSHPIPVPWIEPRDVSNAVLFLASDESRYVTGSELKVDAGYTAK
jgi:SDR family mycofactocin-dependent oxidoreductase